MPYYTASGDSNLKRISVEIWWTPKDIDVDRLKECVDVIHLVLRKRGVERDIGKRDTEHFLFTLLRLIICRSFALPAVDAVLNSSV